MAVGVPTYTGENAGRVLQKSTGERVSQAQEKMADRILGAEQFKYTERKKEEAEFLKNVYIKPEYLISTKARTEMANSLKGFNERWTRILKDNKGILPFDYKVQMQNEKALLESTQNDLLEQMGQWKMMNDAVQRDNGVNYDKDEWDQITNRFLETGRIDITQPPLKSLNPYLYFQKNPVTGTAGYDAKTNKGYSATPQEASIHIGESILSNPRLMQGVIKDFKDNATEEEKIRFLDINNDRVISTAEAENSNAILDWAKEKYSKWAIKETAYKPTKAKTTTTDVSKFNKNLPISATNNRNDEYDLQPALTIPTTNYGKASMSDFVPISVKNATPVFLTITDVYKFDNAGNRTNEKLSEAESVSWEVLGYSPSSDMLMLKATSDGNNIYKEDVVAVDAARFDKYLKGTFGLYREGYKRTGTPKNNTQDMFIFPNAGQSKGTKGKLY